MKPISSYTLNPGAKIPSLRKQSEGLQRSSKIRRIIQRNSFLIARIFFIAFLLFFFQRLVLAQNCATSGLHNELVSENTYYSAAAGTLASGSTSITLSAVTAGYGASPIAVGDQVLIIQMQGAQFNSVNTGFYGGNTVGVGSGISTTNLAAGNMEFATATSAVPITGGVLTLASGTVNAYTKSAYGAWGQFAYQVIRIPSWYNIQLTATINTPLWNGAVGGVTVISAVNRLDFNGQTINALGAGFRGGGGIKYQGAAGTSKLDYMTLSTTTANNSKGEGIAGTPRYVNNNGALLDNVVEGYPGGSFARGAPGNAGGGGTDSDPTSNDQNTGGGGGGNGGSGGGGGNGWSSAGTTGGKGGSSFTTNSPYTVHYNPSRLIMGGGGGAGTTNDGTGIPAGGFASSGASGGGLVIVTASTIIGTGSINASGATGNSTAIIDGSGGGGAGGSVLVYAASGLSNITVIANGGNGGSNDPGSVSATQHGPGGGGGGGVVYANAPLNVASSVSGGSAGISNSLSQSNNYGALNGFSGVLTQNITFSLLPVNMETCQGTIVLPIELLEFNAAYKSNHTALVSWKASNEMNTGYFEVERSMDASDFISLGNVSVNNSGGESHDYSFNDYLHSVTSAVVYYRLKMVNIDGTYTYSKIASVSLVMTEAKFSVFPNPTSDYAVLRFYSEKQSVALMKLMDNSGREIMYKSFTVNTGNNSLMLDQLNTLPKGVYIVQVMVNNSLYNNKLVKQ